MQLYRRLQAWLQRWLEQHPRIAFLLFNEKHPKHHVIESPLGVITAMALICPIIACDCAIMLWAFRAFGIIGMLLTYPVIVYVSILIPHLIWDR